jgi:hypothetical protein
MIKFLMEIEIEKILMEKLCKKILMEKVCKKFCIMKLKIVTTHIYTNFFKENENNEKL